MTERFIINEVPVSEYGFTITARTSSDVLPSDRTGDRSRYTIELEADDSVIAEGPLVWSFGGEIERRAVIAALRELANQLEQPPGQKGND